MTQFLKKYANAIYMNVFMLVSGKIFIMSNIFLSIKKYYSCDLFMCYIIVCFPYNEEKLY